MAKHVRRPAPLPALASMGLCVRSVRHRLAGWPNDAGVYFVQMVDVPLVKIGYATNINQRIIAMQTGAPNDLELLALCPGTSSLEARYHDQFWKHHHRAEWFRLESPIEAEIARLRGLYWSEKGGRP